MIFTEPSLVDKLVVKTHVFWGSSDPLSQGGEESPHGWNKPWQKPWSKIMSYMSHSVFGGKEGTRDIHGLSGEGVNFSRCVLCMYSAEFL